MKTIFETNRTIVRKWDPSDISTYYLLRSKSIISNHINSRKCMDIKLRKVGDSIGTSFPKEVLDRLGLVEGDTINLVVTDDGIELVIHDPNFDKMMEAYQLGSSQYRNAMREISDVSEL